MYNFWIKYKSSLQFCIKLFIVGLAYWLITLKIKNQVWANTTTLHYFTDSKSVLIFISISLLSLANWFLEIKKWQLLSNSIQSISFLKASQQSLSALTVSLLTPNRIGEYGAKAMFFSKIHRKKILGLNLIGNMAQLTTTVIFGTIGLAFLLSNSVRLSKTINLAALLISIPLVLIGLWFLRKIPAIKKGMFKIWHLLTVKTHIKNILLSTLKYFIFSHQFYAFMLFFSIDVPYPIAIATIATMYLISSIIPGFLILDWLVKGSVALTLFSMLQVGEIEILYISSMMWLLNFALPAAIGGLCLLGKNTYQEKMPIPIKP